jgi:hypothetical protein
LRSCTVYSSAEPCGHVRGRHILGGNRPCGIRDDRA